MFDLPFGDRRLLYAVGGAFLAFWCALFALYVGVGAVEIDLETTQTGRLKLFWSDSREGYSEDRSAIRQVGKGRSVQKFRLTGSGAIRQLRVNSDFYHSYVRISQLRIHSPFVFGQTYGGAESIRQLKILKGIDQVEYNESLKFRVEGRDASIEIRLPAQGKKWRLLFLFALLAAGMVALGMLGLICFLHARIPFAYRILLLTVWVSVIIVLSGGVMRFYPISFSAAAVTSMLIALLLFDLFTLIAAQTPGRKLLASLEKFPLIAVFLFGILYVGISHFGVYREIVKDYFSGQIPVEMKGKAFGFPEYFSQLFRNHFALRDDLVYLNAMVKIFGFGHSPTEKVLLGKDGYYFEGYGDRRVEGDFVKSYDNVSDYMGLLPFGNAELEQWTQTLEERKRWLEERGIRYVFVLAPTKALIYPEKLPDSLQKIKSSLGQPTRYEQLSQYLQANAMVPFVDLRHALLKAKKLQEAPPLFYRTDFHWNFLGAFYAYRAIMEVVNDSYPELGVKPLELEAFVLKIDKQWAHERFMNMVGLLKVENHRDDWYIRMQPKFGTPLDTVEQLPETGVQDISRPRRVLKKDGKEFRFDEIRNPGGQLDSILVLGDSFIEKTLLYFSAHAQSTMFIRSVDSFSATPYEFVKPDIVIQEILNMYILQPPPVNRFL